MKLFRDHAIHPFRDHSSRAEIGKLSSAAEILLMVLQSVQLKFGEQHNENMKANCYLKQFYKQKIKPLDLKGTKLQHRIELNPEIGSCRIAQVEPNRCKANSERFPAIGCWSMQICALIGCITDFRGDFFERLVVGGLCRMVASRCKAQINGQS